MLIGIPAGKSSTQYYLNQAYVDYVAAAGFTPILITPANNIPNLATLCDGLLLPGGIDIEPTFYGENNVGSYKVNPEKDDFEREILHAFRAEDRPIFGICRGFQLIVREFISMYGNDINHNDVSYYQHINHHALVDDRNIPRTTPSHSVDANTSVLYGHDAGANDEIFVNSIHHQALVAKNPAGFRTVIDPNTYMRSVAHTEFGLSNNKGAKYVIEAVDVLWEGVKLRGVQWHPEELKDVSIIQTFFGEAGAEVPQNEENFLP